MPRGFDPKPNNPAVGQLVHLHAGLGAKLLANQQERATLAADMRHVEAVIRMFDPAYDVRRIAVKRRNGRNPWFKRGTVFVAALDALRTAEKPLTSRDVTMRMLAKKGIAEPGRDALINLIATVQTSLRNHTGKSVVNTATGIPARWALAPEPLRD